MKIASNRKAFYDYQITDQFEAGLVLTGEEIKAIRSRRANITGSFIRALRAENGSIELFLLGSHFNVEKGDQTRTKKLLMHRKEIDKIANELNAKDIQVIPIDLYLTRGIAKLKIGLGRRKKKDDKRNLIKERDISRRLEKRLKT